MIVAAEETVDMVVAEEAKEEAGVKARHLNSLRYLCVVEQIELCKVYSMARETVK